MAFVILHYNGLKDTYKCVYSILDNLGKKEISIVIVDNNSKDGEGEILKTTFLDYNNVHVILNEINHGFSKGNNIGCDYSKKIFNPDFVCVINNDIYIDSSDFIDIIYDKYDSTKFDILGPNIWNIKRNYNQNPFKVISSLEEVDEAIRRITFSEKLLDSKFPILFYLYNLFFKAKSYSEESLNGAALIFSKKYLDKYSNIFPEFTFMYGEENLLFYRKKVDNLNFYYDEQLKVFHNHSSSTRNETQSVVKKWKFQQKFTKIALFKLKEIYENHYEI